MEGCRGEGSNSTPSGLVQGDFVAQRLIAQFGITYVGMISAQLPTSHVTLNKSLPLSEPQFPLL